MIRRATMDDMPELMRLARDFHHASHKRKFEVFEACAADWERHLARHIQGDGLLCLVAMDGDVVAGFCFASLFPIYFAPHRTMAATHSLWVDRASRRKGLASGMLRASSEWAKGLGAVAMAAGANRDLDPGGTGAMLRSVGFRREEDTYVRFL